MLELGFAYCTVFSLMTRGILPCSMSCCTAVKKEDDRDDCFFVD